MSTVVDAATLLRDGLFFLFFSVHKIISKPTESNMNCTISLNFDIFNFFDFCGMYIIFSVDFTTVL